MIQLTVLTWVAFAVLGIGALALFAAFVTQRRDEEQEE